MPFVVVDLPEVDLAQLRGPAGRDGRDGKDGKDGRDGRDAGSGSCQDADISELLATATRLINVTLLATTGTTCRLLVLTSMRFKPA